MHINTKKLRQALQEVPWRFDNIEKTLADKCAYYARGAGEESSEPPIFCRCDRCQARDTIAKLRQENVHLKHELLKRTYNKAACKIIKKT